MPIVVYHSNIISYVSTSQEQAQALKGMSILEPVLCIYSNLDAHLRKPTKTHVLPEFNPIIIAKTLDLDDEVTKEFTEEMGLGNTT